MSVPKVTITLANGALGQTTASTDGLLCLAVCGASAVDGTFDLATPYSIRKLSGLDTLGITEENNALLYKTVSDFYGEADNGTKLWIVGYPDTLKMSDVLNKNNPYLTNVIQTTGGNLRGIIVTKTAEESPTITSGLNSDVPTARTNAQALREWAMSDLYAPLFVILDGLDFSGDIDALVDMTTGSTSGVAVVIGATSSGASNQAVGIVAGRIAVATVDTNIGRVSDGALTASAIYAGTTAIENADTDTLTDKSYMTFRTFSGIAGYYIADDFMGTASTDDYNHLTALRTIDKAYRVAYNILVTKLLSKVQVKSDGTMQSAVITAWEKIVESAIKSNMTASDELSDDDGDGGVECSIDADQDVLATSTIEIELRVRPFGYARFINVTLGFTVNS